MQQELDQEELTPEEVAQELVDMRCVPAPNPMNFWYLEPAVPCGSTLRLILTNIYAPDHVHVILQMDVDNQTLELDGVCLNKDRPHVILRHPVTGVLGLALVLRSVEGTRVGVQVVTDGLILVNDISKDVVVQ